MAIFWIFFCVASGNDDVVLLEERNDDGVVEMVVEMDILGVPNGLRER